MTRLGIGTNGREYKNFRQQMGALSACRMTLGYGNSTIDAKPIERFSTWNNPDGDSKLDPGVIELTGKFYESLRGGDRGFQGCFLAVAVAADHQAFIGGRVPPVGHLEQRGIERVVVPEQGEVGLHHHTGPPHGHVKRGDRAGTPGVCMVK